MERVLVYGIGELGDSLIMLPGSWAIRKHFPSARLTLLCNYDPAASHVTALDVFRGVGIFDEFLWYTPAAPWKRPMDIARLFTGVRKRRFDAVAYLVPGTRSVRQRKRDALFFRAAGIKKLIGFDGYVEHSYEATRRPLPVIEHESDAILARLRTSGIETPAPGDGSLDLMLAESEEAAVDAWLATEASDEGRPWIGIGASSKMQSKCWPVERYADVVQTLIDRFDVWPITFGGAGDWALNERLLNRWHRGFNAAGKLDIRGSAAALRRCQFYLGNDTGTMHLAAAAGTRCLAVFSSRDYPGRWHPYGMGHVVLRTEIACEGCMLHVCRERANECLQRISVPDVAAMAAEMLRAKLTKATAHV